MRMDTAAAASTVRTLVDFDVPQGACDCHVHVFDPENFPYDVGRLYTPPPASIPDLCNLQVALHFDRAVIVAPSVYATDNSCTIDAVRRLGARARGVVVIDKSVGTDTLDDMAAVGVRRPRLHLENAGDNAAVGAQ